MSGILSENDLLAAAKALGAQRVAGGDGTEYSLLSGVRGITEGHVKSLREMIRAGQDPLGEAFCVLRSPEVRRQNGATYTPQKIVDAMLEWAKSQGAPSRVVDPGVGSGRFLIEAGRVFPHAELVGVDVDPVAVVMTKANLAASGLTARAAVVLGDFREVSLSNVSGRTLFIGNPPYVRHHQIGEAGKRWLVETAGRYGLAASQLAGLHVHFFLAVLLHAAKGDLGCFITAAEWLDVNYGQVLRDLLVGELGAISINVVEPTASPFPDAASTAAITCFQVASRPKSVRFRRVGDLDSLGSLGGGRPVRRERLESARRWTSFTRCAPKVREGFVELGELCRVHRGQVTGANKVWISGPHSSRLPKRVQYPSITKAKELFAVGEVLVHVDGLRRVIDLPEDLDEFDAEELSLIEAFLRIAKAMGADQSYIAKNRRSWWSVGLREPAPILATYMARRPPAFVRNLGEARHINVAHGLYPREPLDDGKLRALARFLSVNVSTVSGRTYAGGLTKFEPREMERLMVPCPALLGELSPLSRTV